MKKTRLVALVALVAVCIAGWTVLGMNAVSEVKTQKDITAAKSCSSFRFRIT